jgi:hypothetical protein
MAHRGFSPYPLPDVVSSIALAHARQFQIEQTAMAGDRPDWEAFVERDRQERVARLRARLNRIASLLKPALWVRTPKALRAPVIG